MNDKILFWFGAIMAREIDAEIMATQEINTSDFIFKLYLN